MSEQEIQDEIEQTRERLGQTVDELAARADVKARARATAAEMKARTRGKAMEVKAKAQAKAAGLAGASSQGQAVERYGPIALTAVGVLTAGAALIWRRHQT